MKKRIDIIYNTNEQEWALEAIAKKHGFTLTDNCYWVQIMRNQDGDSIVLTREDSEQAHDPVGRLIAILETTETETTETETTETETTETEDAETAQQEESNGIKWETIDGLATPCNLESISDDEIICEIEQLKREAAPIDYAMEADNVPLEEWQEMRAESAALWEKIGVLQYVFYIPGAQRFQTERRFYNTESGDVLTLKDLLLCWSKHKCLRKGWLRFGWYVAACQTYQGGTLEEIR